MDPLVFWPTSNLTPSYLEHLGSNFYSVFFVHLSETSPSFRQNIMSEQSFAHFEIFGSKVGLGGRGGGGGVGF
jgi:hypothetical protein